MSLLERIAVEYDTGHFDKDEQGWCSHHHRLSVEGDTVRCEEWGDFNGQRPFSSAWQARIVYVDEAAEVVVLARGETTLYFDGRTERLVQVRPVRVPPSPARPDLLLRALASEAHEVGSMLSSIDHGGGDQAWKRIGVATEAAKALLATFPDAITAAGAPAATEAFVANATSRWSELDALAAARPASASLARADALADAETVRIALGVSAAAGAALARAALASYPATAPYEVKAALREAARADEGSRRLFAAGIARALMPI